MSSNMDNKKWPWLLLTLVLITVIFHPIAAVPIDNGVVGTPEVICGAESIDVDFTTKNSFKGNVYIKGHHTDANCHTGATNTNDVSISINHLDCNVQRARSLQPAGIEISTTVVISFHTSFLTKIDRAFALSCFYMEATKTVKASVIVSMPPSEPLTRTVQMPQCIYEVLRGGPNGSPVKYARIGEPVYHKWTCESELEGVFCMLVHSCYVEDTYDGERHNLVDQSGCSVDPFLLQQIEYNGELSAGRESHVFKFADRPQLFFQCQISITVREEQGGNCPLPSCPVTYDPLTSHKLHPTDFHHGGGGSSSRGLGHNSPLFQRGAFHRRTKRMAGLPELRETDNTNSNSSTSRWTMDTASRKINILDIDEEIKDLKDNFCQNENAPYVGEEYDEDGRSVLLIEPGGHSKVCVSTAAFTIVISATILIAICTVLAITIAVYRRSVSEFLNI